MCKWRWLWGLWVLSTGCNESPAPPQADDRCRLRCETAVETCYEEICWDRWGDREADAKNETARRRIVEDMVACRRACAFHTDTCLRGCAAEGAR